MLGLLGWGRARQRPKFNAPMLSTDSVLYPQPMVTGTFTRASAQYITDFEGETRKVESGSVAVEGSRVVTNLLTYSEDLSNAVWNVAGLASKSGNTITFTGDGSVSHAVTASCVVGSPFRYNVKLSGNGTVTLRVRDNDFNGVITRKTVTLSATPTLFSMTYTPTNNTTGVICYLLYGTATSVTFHSAQLENVTGQSNQNPGEYVKTTSVAVTKCFATTNGNTVDANGVVTEATGTALPQSYPERANSTAYALNQRIQVSGWWYNCTTAGTSDSSAPTFPQGKAGSQTVTDGTAVWTIGGRLLLGYVSEPASTNKTTAYGIIPADTLGSELASGTLTIGQKYQITARTDADFTAAGAANNTVGTQFVATAATVTLDAGDKVKRVQWGVGEKSYHNGSSFVQNITGLTLSGGTAAVLSIVTDETEITAAGLAGINPTYKVYKLDNSAGSTSARALANGTSGNTNAHSISGYARKSSTGGSITYEDTYDAAIAGSSYSRVYGLSKTPAGAYSRVGAQAPAGQIVYFLLPQLEEQTSASSICPSAGGTCTRAATVLSYPTTGIFSLPLSGTFYWTPTAVTGSTARYLWGSYADASNYIGVFYDGTNVTFRKRVGGSNYDATKALTAVSGTTYKIGWRINADYSTDIAVDSVLGTGNDGVSNELVTNAADREFSSDTGYYFKGTGWTISGGVATQDGLGAYEVLASTGLNIKAGYSYDVTYTVTAVSGGSCRTIIGGTVGTGRSAPGTYTERIVATNTNQLQFNNNGAGSFSIDNVSVKEVALSPPAATTTFWLGNDGNGGSGVISSQVKDFKIYRKALPDARL